MANSHAALRYQFVSSTGTGTLTLGAAVDGYLALGASHDGLTFAYSLREGDAFEWGTGTYTHSGTTFTRAVVESSNGGSAIDLAGNAPRLVAGSPDPRDLDKWAALSALVVENSGNITFGADLLPVANDAYNAGSDSLRISEGHFQRIYIAGTKSTAFTALDIAKISDNAANISTNASDIGDLDTGLATVEGYFAAAISDGTYVTANGDKITVADGIVTDFTKGTGPYGYRISNNTTDADHYLDIAAGACLSWDRTTWIAGAAITKRFDAAWAAGNDNGGMDTGSMPTDGGLYLYAIYHPSSGVDYIGSTAAPTTGPSLPTGYTKYAYIGYRPTDSSANFYGVTQFGTYHEFSSSVHIVEVTNPGLSDITATATAPEFAVITVRLYFRNTNGADGGSNLRVGPTPDSPQRYEAYVNPSSTDQSRSEKYVTVLLDDSQQFLFNVDTSFSNLRVAMWMASWRDERLAGLGT